jgi:hypothetical protein
VFQTDDTHESITSSKRKKVTRNDEDITGAVLESEFRAIRANVSHFRGTDNGKGNTVFYGPSLETDPKEIAEEVRECAPAYTKFMLDQTLRRGVPVDQMDPDNVHNTAYVYVSQLSQIIRFGNRKATRGAKLESVSNIREMNGSRMISRQCQTRTAMHPR